MLEVKGLKKTFDNNEVLKGVDLRLGKGDVLAVLGPSGSGKTTMLRCLNFLERADEGALTFLGTEHDMPSMKPKQIAEYRRHTAFVFQSFNLFLNKTAIQNVTEGLTVARRMPKAEARERAERALIEVGLEGKFDSRPNELSGGQQQRVAIARAIAADPDVIFFDEPTSALDPELIGGVLDVIRSLAEEGRTMIVVTHEMSFARNAASRVMFMDGGRVLADESAHEFFEEHKLPRIQAFLNKIEREI